MCGGGLGRLRAPRPTRCRLRGVTRSFNTIRDPRINEIVDRELAELAGRSGGRLSSLFLDEGFGTLDANALDEALEELERRAASGRVIGVISHLRSVADRMEHVLRVDKELGRTTVRWIDGSERDAMTVDGLAHAAGLTS